MHRQPTLACLALALACPTLAAGDGIELNPFVGYAVGGEFRTESDIDAELKADATGGLALAVPVAGDWQIELFWLHQGSDLEEDFFGGATLTEMSVDYYHLSGLRFWNYDRFEPLFFVSGGVTSLDPEGSAGTETRLSFGLGGGVRVYLGERKRFGLRFAGRLLGTYFGDDAQVFCSASGCLGEVAESFLIQGAVDAGVTVRLDW